MYLGITTYTTEYIGHTGALCREVVYIDLKFVLDLQLLVNEGRVEPIC